MQCCRSGQNDEARIQLVVGQQFFEPLLSVLRDCVDPAYTLLFRCGDAAARLLHMCTLTAQVASTDSPAALLIAKTTEFMYQLKG